MDIEAIITQHTDAETGKTDAKAVANAINTELPKDWIPKDQFNKQTEQLKEAQQKFQELQNSHKDDADLQSSVNDWQEKYKEQAVRSALLEAGASDMDYMLYKLGKVELNRDGSIRDLDSKIKNLKESNAGWFKVNEPQKPAEKAPADSTPPTPPQVPTGYSVMDNKLPEGQTPNPLDAVRTTFANALG